MSTLIVKPVTNRREKKQFLHLPWSLYRDDPNWIPPLRMNQKELVGYARHPFYDNAEGQTFLAIADGKPAGRLLALVNRAHNERYRENRGFFGFFECIEDQEVASGLFDAAREWLAERGMQSIRGPANPSLNYECGLLVDGFDSPPTFMMTYNPPFYADLIEGYGFRKVEDMYAFYGHVDMIDTLDSKLRYIIEGAKERFDVKTRTLNKRRFREEVRMFLDIYNRSLLGTWGFVPLAAGEIEHMSASLRWLIIPELTTVAEVEGKQVAAVFGLLDYNHVIRQMDGRLFPLGFLTLLSKRRTIPKARIIAANVLPEFQKWGLGLLLLDELLPDSLKWGLREVEFSWVLESNHLSRSSLERGGAILQKTYRMYDIEL
jgi:GNAT superfamily N-acetyltransferase